MRNLCRTAALGLIAAVAFTAGTAGAQADSSHAITDRTGRIAGKATFTSKGNILRVKDTRRDGMRVSVDVYDVTDHYKHVGECVNRKGSGTTKHCQVKAKNGHRLEFVGYARWWSGVVWVPDKIDGDIWRDRA